MDQTRKVAIEYLDMESPDDQNGSCQQAFLCGMTRFGWPTKSRSGNGTDWLGNYILD